jgi:hypothetical protein
MQRWWLVFTSCPCPVWIAVPVRADMYPSSNSDSVQLQQARQIVGTHIQDWISAASKQAAPAPANPIRHRAHPRK